MTLRFRVDESVAVDGRSVLAASPGREAQSRGRSAAVDGTGIQEARADRRRPKAAGVPVLRHRLDDFVVGESNRLAHGAAMRLAESSGREKFSPLFIHGSCGLGKTHLLHGLASRYLEIHPHAVVRAITAEEFTNDYVMAVKNNRLDEFRRVYRGVDLLCLDDAHFLSNKEKTQTELLHTFDAIDLGGSRIVLASDDHPREIRKMSEQLVSRFLSGAVVRLDPPDPATRLNIILAIARRRGLPIDPAAADLISERGARCGPGGTPGSVRDIEGMLTQVEAYYRLVPEMVVSGSVGVVLVRRALNIGEIDGRGEPARSRRPVEVDRINAEVCRTLGVTVQEMMGVGRHPKVVLARSVIALLSRRLTNLSFPEIARRMGRPNHSTVITAKKRLEATIAENQSARTADWAGVDLGVEFEGTTAREFVERVARILSRSSD